jgi:hypothetical protein
MPNGAGVDVLRAWAVIYGSGSGGRVEIGSVAVCLFIRFCVLNISL